MTLDDDDQISFGHQHTHSFYDAVGGQDVNVTVVDDEVAPLVTLSASATTVTEDSGTIKLTATQTFATASDTTVTLTGTGNGITAVTIQLGQSQSQLEIQRAQLPSRQTETRWMKTMKRRQLKCCFQPCNGRWHTIRHHHHQR